MLGQTDHKDGFSAPAGELSLDTLEARHPVFRSLKALCHGAADPLPLTSLLSFISKAEIADVLADWSEESRYAAELAALSTSIWAMTGSGIAVTAYDSARRSDRRFKRSQLKEQYLAVGLASSRLIENESVAAWLERLKVLLLIRALEALADGYPRELHIYELMLATRQACDWHSSPIVQHFAPLANRAASMDAFVQQAIIGADAARQGADLAPNQTKLYTNLLHLLERKPWARLPTREGWQNIDDLGEPKPADRTRPDPVAPPTSTKTPTAQDGKAVESDPAKSTRGQENAEKGLRLEAAERHLFLWPSWHQWSKSEAIAARRRVADLLGSASQTDRLGAASVYLALLCCSSMHDIESLRFKDNGSGDWWLELVTATIHRSSPRFPRRWSAPTEAHPPILTPAEHWRLRLPKQVRKALAASANLHPEVETLGLLWQCIEPSRSMVNWFDAVFCTAGQLKRMSAPSTARMLDMHVFQRAGDHLLARLVAADHRTALPAAAAYSAYTTQEVVQVLHRALKPAGTRWFDPSESQSANAAGSELDLDLRRARQSIEALISRIETLSGSSPAECVQQHNLLVGLVATALFASTGGRPISSPFESLNSISFAKRLLTLADKESDPDGSVRVVVLSNFAHDLLTHLFLPHLQRLTEAVAPSAPGFAAKLKALLSGDSNAKLPLLFFLQLNPTLDWREVRPSALQELVGLWEGLPENVFRHLHATYLRRAGLHPDIRDALLGHGTRLCESHGKFSVRVPMDDLESARPLIDHLQVELGFRLPRWAGPTTSALATVVSDSNLALDRTFGRLHRAQHRAETQAAAKARARKELEQLLSGRSVEQLSSEELDSMARAMLFRSDGIPHVQANIRYETFEAVLRANWDQHGKHAKRSKRYLLHKDPRQCFTEGCLSSEAALDAVAQRLEASEVVQRRTTPGPVMAACLAALDILLYSRLADPRPLKSLVMNRREELGLVLMEGRYWLEWGFGAARKDGHAVFRIEISDRAALWTSLALQSKRRLESPPSIPEGLKSLQQGAPLQEGDVGNLLQKLCELRRQANALTLPGFEAAHLSGQLMGSGLPHSDWLRYSRGGPAREEALAETKAPDEAEQQSFEEIEHFFRAPPSNAQPPAGLALERAQRLFQQISNWLGDSNLQNLQIAQRIQSSICKSGFGAGDAPHALAHFVVHLLRRKPQKGDRDLLRGSTVRRYWYSLAWPVQETMADCNLLDADEEDLVQWYAALVSSWESAPAAPVEREKSGADPQAVTAQSSDAASRTLAQLQDWHAFLAENHGIPDPDWSEVASDLKVPSGRPGLILHREYHIALRKVLGTGDVDTATEIDVAAAFVMLCGYRFGLRLSEALGLRRCDWLDSGNSVVVLVEAHRKRSLKTEASRRKIPLIGELDPVELALVNRVLRDWLYQEAGEPRTLLLGCIQQWGFKSALSRVQGPALATLKHVTRCRRATLHQLRHSFAMRVAANLLGRRLEPDPGAPWCEPMALRQLLTGRAEPDRRLLWAVARLLGHASPSTTLTVYVNCVHLWQRITPPAHPIRHGTLQLTQLIDLDRVHVDERYLEAGSLPRLVAPAPAANPILAALRFLKLVMQDHAEHRIDTRAGLSDQQVATLSRALWVVSGRIPATQHRFATYELLQPLGSKGLHRLAKLVEPFAYPDNAICAREGWLYTVSKRKRQLLLFDESQLASFASFCSWLKLSSQEVWLVQKKRPSPRLPALASTLGLSEFLVDQTRPGASFQLDVAHVGEQGYVATDRVAVVCAPKGRLKNSFELIVLWVLWNAVGREAVQEG